MLYFKAVTATSVQLHDDHDSRTLVQEIHATGI